MSGWSETGTFFVDLVNTAPTAPEIVSPYADATMPDENGYFIWFASDDADIGDFIAGYRLQIAEDVAFTNILADVEVGAQSAVLLAQLKTLPGYGALGLNARYFCVSGPMTDGTCHRRGRGLLHLRRAARPAAAP